MAFYSGEGGEDYSYLFTRSYAKWIGESDIKMMKKDYSSINNTIDILYNPWKELV